MEDTGYLNLGIDFTFLILVTDIVFDVTKDCEDPHPRNISVVYGRS